MPPSLITLTTDYGDTAPYVAAVKGVILSVNPAARLLDLTHRIRPQGLRQADYYLGVAVPHFPPGTIHLAVIDPGVGGERAAILIEVCGQFLIGPDNGIFTSAVRKLGGQPRAWRLAESRFWRREVSATFHGRDIFAPVAAHLSLGTHPDEFGPHHPSWVELSALSAVCWRGRCRGEVQFVDDFGNLITNIPAGAVKALPIRVALAGGEPYPLRWVRTYCDAAPGELISLFSSDGFFEIATVNGSAAERLGAYVGTEVDIEFDCGADRQG